VDVEPLARGDETLHVARTVFAPAELAELARLPLEEKRDRAVSLWTLKESYIKARGLGMSLPLRAFGFQFDAAEPRIRFEPSIADDASRWSFRTLDAHGSPHRGRLRRGKRTAAHPRTRLRADERQRRRRAAAALTARVSVWQRRMLWGSRPGQAFRA
jgi:4'-phosphopantetheinyl transferase